MDTDSPVFQLARALSDPLRIRIAALLVEHELTLEQIATELRLRPIDVARHVSLLRDSGLVVEIARTNPVHYRLDTDALRGISREAFATGRPSSPDMSGEDWERKVLRDFVKDNRLVAIPSSHKKKIVILRWLTTLIPTDAQLSEREISELLKAYHPDFATLRRELVDNSFLRRERGVYWRAD